MGSPSIWIERIQVETNGVIIRPIKIRSFHEEQQNTKPAQVDRDSQATE